MLTHKGLFNDITLHLLRWFLDDSHGWHTAILQLPRTPHYSIQMNGLTGAVTVVAYDDPDYPYGVSLDHPCRSKNERLKDHAAVAQQVARLMDTHPIDQPMSQRQSHFCEELTNLLIRVLCEQLTLTVDIRSRGTRCVVGLTGTLTRFNRVIYNHAFDRTLETERPVTPDESLTVPERNDFLDLHHRHGGTQRVLFYHDVSSLEAIAHQRGVMTLVEGLWPLIAFTAISGEGSDQVAGIGFNTPQGWLVVMQDPGHDPDPLRPYLIHQIPDVMKQRWDLDVDFHIGDEMLELLLASNQLNRACMA